MDKEDKILVTEERKRQGVAKMKRRGKPSSVKTNKKKLAKMTREISSLKSKYKSLKKKKGASTDEDDDDADEPQSNAGDQFGGRKSKKNKKNGD